MSSLLNKIWDRMNPIVVKELRQCIQARLFRIVIMLFMLIQFLVFTMMLVDANSSSMVEFYLGREFFAATLVQMTIVVVIIIPVLTGSRFLSDLEGDSMDLLYTTSITPRKLVFGKFWATQLNSLMVVSLCLPFLASAYFLRGIDIPSIFRNTAFCFLLGMPMTALFILSGVAPGSTAIKRGRSVAGVFAGLFLLMSSSSGIAFTLFANRSGVVVQAMVGFATVIVLCTLFLLMASLTFVSPESANRSKPLRIYLSCIMLFTGAVCMGISLYYRHIAAVIIWFVLEMVITLVTTGLLINEPVDYSYRVRTEVPKNFFGRLLAFPHFCGGVNGYVFGLVRGITLILIFKLFTSQVPFGISDVKEVMAIFVPAFAYICGYAGFGYVISRVILGGKVKFLKPAVCGLLVFIFTAMVPMMLSIYGGRQLMVFSPFGLGSSTTEDGAAVVGIVMGIVSILLMSTLIIKAFFKLKRPEPSAAGVPQVLDKL